MRFHVEKTFQVQITVVELEEKFMHLSRKYFGLEEDEKQKVVHCDGIQFLKFIKRRSFFLSLSFLHFGSFSNCCIKSLIHFF